MSVPAEMSGSPATAPPPSTGSILRRASWFGLVAGLAELAVFVLKCRYLDPRNANVSRHFPWMFPVAGLVVVGAPGLVLAAVARVRPGWVTTRAVLGILAFFAYLGFLFRWPIYTAVCLFLAAVLARHTARILADHLEAFDRWAGRSLVVLGILLAATVAVAFGRETWAGSRPLAHPPEGPRGAKNVILIVLDTVRARSLSLYGYPRDTSPNLRRLATRGVRFDRAYATAPWTAPSHASMFTGRWAHELSVGWDRPLDRSSPTLAEYLGGRGYDTAGFVANTTYCSYETGLDRGFAHYEDYDVTPREVLLCSSLVRRTLTFAHKHPSLARLLGEDAPAAGSRKDASRISGDFLGWLDRREKQNPGRPFFAFLNYFDAHHPYLAPERGPGSDDGPTLPPGGLPENEDDVRMLRDWWEIDKRRLGPREVALARDAYDRCNAMLDRQIGRLFDELERRRLLDGTLVVITADHGEHLGEHQLFGHGCSLYLPELHVPLLVIGPDVEPGGRVVDEPVSLRDLPATIVDLLGRGKRKGDAAPFPGRSLAWSWSGKAGASRPPGVPLLSEIEGPPEADPNRGGSPARRGPLTSLVDRDFHYIRDGKGREELYDLRRDPQETRDLGAAPDPDVAATLRRFRDSVRR